MSENIMNMVVGALPRYFIRGVSHIDFRTQCTIMTLAGGGIIANDVLKMRKVIEFQSS